MINNPRIETVKEEKETNSEYKAKQFLLALRDYIKEKVLGYFVASTPQDLKKQVNEQLNLINQAFSAQMKEKDIIFSKIKAEVKQIALDVHKNNCADSAFGRNSLLHKKCTKTDEYFALFTKSDDEICDKIMDKSMRKKYTHSH